ncbi:MAG: GIY-YIG nuclease family protein [Deltaproteobacteria bacterium]|nr:GIY-YIG nuclease family protein [Deltaproteobacteria bacterium]
MASHFVYILEAADGRLYVGYTTDLERRMAQHRDGRGAKFVRGFGFAALRYHETFETKSAALKREVEIKHWSRREKLALIDRVGICGPRPETQPPFSMC